MKRKALLFGNTTAAGAQNDLLNWKTFLKSGRGGAWQDYEIQILSNPSKTYLQAWLKIIKDGDYDFVDYESYDDEKDNIIHDVDFRKNKGKQIKKMGINKDFFKKKNKSK